ncbi:hypothetical protein [Caballeronia sp. RCC_10]|uniref:hypothetical protein n=1 Tax=Caballeronia sp. RCC_10 TaxID=3239227 RepID=UPI0035239B84
MFRLKLGWFLSALLLCLVAIDAAAEEGRRDERHHHAHPNDGQARLYDARGALVGDVVYVSGSGYDGGVVLNVRGVFVFAGFSRVGKLRSDGGGTATDEMMWQYPRLAYLSENCSGTSYVYYERGIFRPSAIERRGTTATLYIARDTISEVTQFGSSIYDGDPPSCDRGAPPHSDRAWPVESTIDLTQLHPEPLRIGR